MDKMMNNNIKITEETMDNLEILSKLTLSDVERLKVEKELEDILSYMNKLNELDTENVEPLIQNLSMENVLREDEVTNENGAQDALMNAPVQRENRFVVPKTV